MGYCPNCKTHLTCGCQKRVSKAGVVGCANCIAQLNGTIITPKPVTITKQNIKTSNQTPTDLTAVYNGPGRQV